MTSYLLQARLERLECLLEQIDLADAGLLHGAKRTGWLAGEHQAAVILRDPDKRDLGRPKLRHMPEIAVLLARERTTSDAEKVAPRCSLLVVDLAQAVQVGTG